MIFFFSNNPQNFYYCRFLLKSDGLAHQSHIIVDFWDLQQTQSFSFWLQNLHGSL